MHGLYLERIAPLAYTNKERKTWALAQTEVNATDWHVLRLLIKVKSVSNYANRCNSAANMKKCKKRKAEQVQEKQQPTMKKKPAAE
jgi:hypothetical protein